MENDVDARGPPGHYVNGGYALSGKIMMSAIIILFFVVILMVCLHLYARWYLIRARRRHIRRVRRRRTHFVFYVDQANPNPMHNGSSRGLDASVLKSLPVFLFSSKTRPDGLDCAVCLSEFEENESGRILPKCNHSFHIDCIDMWFQTHATCPLCRSPVELVAGKPESSTAQPENPTEVAVSVTEPGTNSGETQTIGGRELEANRGLTRTESFMLSFKRMLSRDKRGNASECGGGGGGYVNDSDIERGREENHC